MAIILNAPLFTAKPKIPVLSTTVKYSLYTVEYQQLIAGNGEPLEWQYDVSLNLFSPRGVFPSCVVSTQIPILRAKSVFPPSDILRDGYVHLKPFTAKPVFLDSHLHTRLFPKLLTAKPIFPVARIVPTLVAPLFSPRSVFPPLEIQYAVRLELFTAKPILPSTRRISYFAPPLKRYEAPLTSMLRSYKTPSVPVLNSYKARSAPVLERYKMPAPSILGSYKARYKTYSDPVSATPPVSTLDTLPISVLGYYKAYFLTLTGANDDTSDLDLSDRMTSFSLRVQAEGVTVLRVVLTGGTDIVDKLSVRRNGELVVFRGYAEIDSKIRIHGEELGRVRFESLQYQEGSESRTTTLRGSSVTSIESPVALSIEKVLVTRMSDGIKGLRAIPDDNLRIGDMVIYEPDNFIVWDMTYTVTSEEEVMELTEVPVPVVIIVEPVHLISIGIKYV